MPSILNRTGHGEYVIPASPFQVTSGSHTHDGTYMLVLVFAQKGYSAPSRKCTACTFGGVGLTKIATMDYDSGDSVDQDLTVTYFGSLAIPAGAGVAMATFDSSGSYCYFVIQSLGQCRGYGNIGSDALTPFGSYGSSLTFSVTNQEVQSMAIGVIGAQKTASPFGVNANTTELVDRAGTNFDQWVGYREGSGAQSFVITFAIADAGGKAVEFLHTKVGGQVIWIM